MRPLLTALASVAVFFVAFLITVEWYKGFPERYRVEDRQLAIVDPRALGDYVAPRFEALYLKDFGRNSSKVLLIGDSFAQDFLNIVHESGRDGKVTLSTFHITAACGNLDLDDRLVMARLSRADQNRCSLEQRFKHPVLRQRLAEADHIVLVSAWEAWQIPLIAESLRAIAAKSHADVTIIGRKDFGDIDINAYLRVAVDERRGLRNTVTLAHLQTNEAMKRLLPGGFVDFQSIVCVDQRTCPIFTEDGSLISFDGHHLTREGAIFAGRRLFAASPQLRALFSQ